MTSTHASLAPSSADRNVMCPGSRKLVAMFPQEETIETREGTATHWALAELLNGRAVALGQVAENGVTLNDEMIECAEDTAEYIIARDSVWTDSNTGQVHPTPGGQPKDRAVEVLIQNDVLHVENYGTPDYVASTPYAIFVDDYKHGHKYVEAVGNWQLLNYAILKIADMRSRNQVVDSRVRVTMTVHQPRSYHRDGAHRAWTITVGEADAYIPYMRERYALAMTHDAPVYATDPSVCELCPARHACEAAAAAAYSAYEQAFSSAPLLMSPGAMGLELRKLRRAQSQIKARISGLEEQVTMRLRQPGGVPGWRVDHGIGRVVWNIDSTPQSVIINTGAALGLDISTPGILTPRQALKAGMPQELVDAFSKRNSGKAELVEDDGTLAARTFGGNS